MSSFEEAMVGARTFVLGLGRRADTQGIEVLTPAQATVVRAYAAFGSIRNGGFQDFYESPTWDAAQIAEDFRTAGLKDLAAALRGSLGIFPGGRQLRGRERDAHLARVGQASWRGGEELFYRTKEADFWRAAMVFMRLHRDDFPT